MTVHRKKEKHPFSEVGIVRPKRDFLYSRKSVMPSDIAVYNKNVENTTYTLGTFQRLDIFVAMEWVSQ
jgi:hypothetical protein